MSKYSLQYINYLNINKSLKWLSNNSTYYSQGHGNNQRLMQNPNI